MSEMFMIFPAKDPAAIRLVRIPDDFEAHESYRYVTALIADVEEESPDHTWADIETILEDHGFESLEYVLGPALD